MRFEDVDAFLFDLGNVVIRIDVERAFACWGAHGGCDPALLRERFSHDEPCQQHERGEIDSATSFASLRNSLGLALDDEHLREGWNAIFIEEMPGATLARLGL